MPELISQPGLQFHVFKLHGKLDYSLTIPNKATKKFELSEDDFNIPDLPPTATPKDIATGLHISAVGLELTIVRNTGSLHMHFEGPEGGVGDWTFQNLLQTSRASELCASAGTQTNKTTAPTATQTSMCTFVVRGQQKSNMKPSDEVLEAQNITKGIRVSSLAYNVNERIASPTCLPDEAERQHGELLLTYDVYRVLRF